jgi:hypothetical protein
MFLTFRADESGDAVQYEFQPDKTPWKIATIAEKEYSKSVGERRTWEQLKADALQGGIAARRVALWIAMTKVHPLMPFRDTPEFEAGQLVMEYSRGELRKMRDSIAKSDSMFDGEKDAILAQLDSDILTAPVGRDEPEPEPDPEIEEPEAEPGKENPTGELSNSSETSTG